MSGSTPPSEAEETASNSDADRRGGLPAPGPEIAWGNGPGATADLCFNDTAGSLARIGRYLAAASCSRCFIHRSRRAASSAFSFSPRFVRRHNTSSAVTAHSWRIR